MNIRNPTHFTESFWDWTFLNDCFGSTKIRVSDIDGIVERHGKFLMIETKLPGVALSKGQEILHNALLHTGVFTILLIEGSPNQPIRYSLTTQKNKYEYGPEIASLNHLKLLVEKWFNWANKEKS